MDNKIISDSRVSTMAEFSEDRQTDFMGLNSRPGGLMGKITPCAGTEPKHACQLCPHFLDPLWEDEVDYTTCQSGELHDTYPVCLDYYTGEEQLILEIPVGVQRGAVKPCSPLREI
jgi:hypothetical protein